MNSLRRLAVAFAATAATTLTVVGVPTSAHAATSYSTFTQNVPRFKAIKYGVGVGIQAQVGFHASGTTYAVPGGTQVLDARRSGTTTWVKINTYTGSNLHTWTVHPKVTTQYRVRYLGYTDASTGDKFLASTSPIKTVQVMRNFHDKGNSATLRVHGTMSPAYRNKKITVQKAGCAKGCRWSKISTIRTNGSSAYSVKLPTYAKKTYFRLFIPKSGGLANSYSGVYYTYRY